MERRESDLIIIGAGPGGYETAVEAVADGLSVTLIERDRPGGTCLNRGCIPTKALLWSAEVIETVRSATGFGVNVGEVTADYAVAAARKDEVVAQLRGGVEQLLRGVEVVNGEARFVDSRTVAVGEDLYSAPHIIIATGSKAACLPISGADLCITSDDLLSMTVLPGSMAIIGGGVIGVEFACILNAFGVQVTVLEFCKEILPAFDRDVAKRLRQTLTRKGIKFVTSACVTGVSAGYTVSYENKGKEAALEADAVLMAVGRVPVYPAGLDAAGVEVAAKGIVTDGNMMTSCNGIYAVGDVNGRCQLAHAATAQGRVALAHILGRTGRMKLDVIPSAVFSSPEIAMAGLTEEAAEGMDYAVARSYFRANGKAVAMGETDGLVKILYDKSTGRIMGVHILGPHASDLVQEVVVVMTLGGTLADLRNSIHGHPTLSEVVVSVR